MADESCCMLNRLDCARVHLVLREDGEAPVVGPSSPLRTPRLPALRTVGYRKAGSSLVPILHTKMFPT